MIQQPVTLDQAVVIAVKLHQSGCMTEAEDIYKSVLKLAPDHPDALHYYGLFKHQSGYSQEGVGMIEKALSFSPDYIDANNNLGNIYLQTGELNAAEKSFRRVIELSPTYAPAYNNLGVALKELKQYEASIEALNKAVALDPANSDYYRNLADALKCYGKYDDAIAAYCKGLEIKPRDPETCHDLCNVYYAHGDIPNALKVLDDWLRSEPDNPIPLHLRSALSGEGIPDRASDEYVKQTFDLFAESFDSVLRKLEYKAPSLVDRALRDACATGEPLDILDAGCGTGMCGDLVRPLAKHLSGVDLSGKMLDRARARNVYDELFEAELTAFLDNASSAFDAVICADTLCYFGDLAPALRAAAKALRRGGHFIFTVERLAEGSGDFRLNGHGRYSHARDYLERALAEAGLRPKSIEAEILRLELKKPVEGYLVVAHKTDGA
ncbi:MAG: type 12 methyltransferase [Gallionellaceae bacterium]|nr:MAG: type 12 methyltransferase [Gallionellaceae bacterium]